MPDYLTPRRVAEIVGLTPETVREHIHSGRLAATRSPVNGRWLITEDAVRVAYALGGRVPGFVDVDRVRTESAAGVSRGGQA